jgi:ribose/xylose/arabinose/galactoside ABC-type transport system permease subunit
MTLNFSEQAIAALGMALLILVRKLDLSVAATIALASLAISYTAELGDSVIELFGVGLMLGAACGAFNGALVVMSRLPLIVVTHWHHVALSGGLPLWRWATRRSPGNPANFTVSASSICSKRHRSISPLLAPVFTVVLHLTTW